MSRKKMKPVVKSKAKKTASKRPTKNVGMVSTSAMEKEFKSMPAKLAAQYRKEALTAKLQEKKLSADLKKAQVLNKAILVKQTKTGTKATPTAKKQLATIKKTLSKSNSSITQLSTQIGKVKKTIAALAQKQVKFSTIGKELAKLNKQLDIEALARAENKEKVAKKTPSIPKQKASAKKNKPDTKETQTNIVEPKPHSEEVTNVTMLDEIELTS